MFVATKHVFCHDKSMLVVTKHLSRQKCACRDKAFVKHVFVTTNICHEKGFVATNILLSRQKTCFVATRRALSGQTHVCRDKTFVATKMILVIGPANDTGLLVTTWCRLSPIFVMVDVDV